MTTNVPAPTPQVDAQASLGKSIDRETSHRLVDDRPGAQNAPPADNRSLEDTMGGGGSARAAHESGVDALLADPDKLATMSEADIAKALGYDVNDKSQNLSPSGDGLVHDIDNALANGTATEFTGDVTPPPAAVAAPAATPPAATPPAATPAPPAAAPASATPPAQDEPYVEGRTGGRIAYGVLQGERAQKAALRAENADLKAQLAARSGTPAAEGTAVPAAAPTPPAPVPQAAPRLKLYTQADIDGLNERFDPAIVETMVESRTAAVQSADQVEQLRAELRARDASYVSESVQDVIDEHPLLSMWAAGATAADQAAWVEAQAQDAILQHMPGWKERPWQERIEEAASRTAKILGIPIPSSDPVPNTPAQPSLRVAAAAALQRANGNVTVPTSHSDLPAGVPPAQSEREFVADRSAVDIYATMANMTPDQINAYIARAM